MEAKEGLFKGLSTVLKVQRSKKSQLKKTQLFIMAASQSLVIPDGSSSLSSKETDDQEKM